MFAENVSDFEIEGMSVGDSLLDYLSKEKILSEINSNEELYSWLGKQKFGEVYWYKKFNTYDYLSFFVKPNDENFLIYGIFASFITEEINSCYNTQNKIGNEISHLFNNLKRDKDTYTLGGDPSGKSKATYLNFQFNNGDTIEITCYDFDPSVQTEVLNLDGLDVAQIKSELFKWLFPRD
jgi:hypothetical protein